MRIAIVGPYFWPQMYGIEKVMYAHARYLASRGHEVRVITSRLIFPRGTATELPALEQHDAFTIQRLNVALRAVPFFHYPSNGGLILRGLEGALNAFAPDVIHAHNIGAAAWALGSARYAKRAKAAFFYSTHHHPSRLRFDRLRKIGIRALNFLPLTTASKIYHLTARDLDVFPGDYPYAPQDRFAVLHNGVEPPHAGRLPAGDAGQLQLLFVGRVDDARKGFTYLERALDALEKDVANRYLLSVVGSISDSSRKRLESKYGGAVRIFGAVSEADLEQAYADADIFVMPSLYEGFGMPFIEAMRYGVPVIGTNVGGIPEVVPKDTGLLVPPQDAVSLAAALTRLIGDPQLRSEMASAGRTWSKRFYWESIVDRLEADYRAAIASGDTRRLAR